MTVFADRLCLTVIGENDDPQDFGFVVGSAAVVQFGFLRVHLLFRI